MNSSASMTVPLNFAFDVGKFNVILNELKQVLGPLGKDIKPIDEVKIQASLNAVKGSLVSTDAEINKVATDAGKIGDKFKESEEKVKVSSFSMKGFMENTMAVFGGNLLMSTVSQVQGLLSGASAIAAESVLADKKIEAVLKSTKGAAGITKDNVNELAESMSKLTNFSEIEVKSAEHMLLTFTGISKDAFPGATEAVLNMSTALGQDLKSSSIQLGKALNDPIAGATALRRVGVALTDQQQEQIAVFMKSGDILSAQKIIINELGTEFGGIARLTGTGSAQLKHMVEEVQVSLGMMMRDVTKHIVPVLTTFWGGLKTTVEFLKPMSPALLAGVGAYGLYTLAMHQASAASTIHTMATKIKTLVTITEEEATKGVTVATKLWNAALSANPIFLIVGGVTALAGGLYYLNDLLDKSAEKQLKKNEAELKTNEVSIKLKEDQIKQAESNLGLIDSFEQLGKSGGDVTAMTAKLAAIYPDVVKNGDTFENNLIRVKEAAKGTGKSIEDFKQNLETLFKDKQNLVTLQVKLKADKAVEDLGKDMEGWSSKLNIFKNVFGENAEQRMIAGLLDPLKKATSSPEIAKAADDLNKKINSMNISEEDKAKFLGAVVEIQNAKTAVIQRNIQVQEEGAKKVESNEMSRWANELNRQQGTKLGVNQIADAVAVVAEKHEVSAEKARELYYAEIKNTAEAKATAAAVDQITNAYDEATKKAQEGLKTGISQEIALKANIKTLQDEIKKGNLTSGIGLHIIDNQKQLDLYKSYLAAIIKGNKETNKTVKSAKELAEAVDKEYNPDTKKSSKTIKDTSIKSGIDDFLNAQALKRAKDQKDIDKSEFDEKIKNLEALKNETLSQTDITETNRAKIVKDIELQILEMKHQSALQAVQDEYDIAIQGLEKDYGEKYKKAEEIPDTKEKNDAIAKLDDAFALDFQSKMDRNYQQNLTLTSDYEKNRQKLIIDSNEKIKAGQRKDLDKEVDNTTTANAAMAAANLAFMSGDLVAWMKYVAKFKEIMDKKNESVLTSQKVVSDASIVMGQSLEKMAEQNKINLKQMAKDVLNSVISQITAYEVGILAKNILTLDVPGIILAMGEIALIEVAAGGAKALVNSLHTGGVLPGRNKLALLNDSNDNYYQEMVMNGQATYKNLPDLLTINEQNITIEEHIRRNRPDIVESIAMSSMMVKPEQLRYSIDFFERNFDNEDFKSTTAMLVKEVQGLRQEIRELKEQNSKENNNIIKATTAKKDIHFDSNIELGNDKMLIAFENAKMETARRY